MRPILLIMWATFQSFTLRHNNDNDDDDNDDDNNNKIKHIRLLLPKAVLGKRKPPLKVNLRFSKDIVINFKCSIQQVQMKYYRVEFFGTVSEVQKERGTLVVVRSHHPKISVKRIVL